MARVIVTGSRYLADRSLMLHTLAAVRSQFGQDTVIVHGGAKGADTLAADCADELGLKTEAWPADWKTHGRSAGPKRNQAMVNAGADMCIAFLVEGQPCNGTRDCARRARLARIQTVYLPEELR
jgi:hypothetical protein